MVRVPIKVQAALPGVSGCAAPLSKCTVIRRSLIIAKWGHRHFAGALDALDTLDTLDVCRDKQDFNPPASCTIEATAVIVTTTHKY